MTEPTVQVPVSLPTREQIQNGAVAEFEGKTLTVDLDAVSQPTPTAEPPRIEDLAPGTTFTARGGMHFTVLALDIIQDAAKRHYLARQFDPSTIRDVQPPAGA